MSEADPYRPPEAAIQPEAGDRGSALVVRVALWLILIVCVLQFWGVIGLLLREHALIGRMLESGDMSYGDIALAIGQPGSLFLGGVLLFFQRKLAVPCFVAYLLVSVIWPGSQGPNVLSILLCLAMLAFCLHLWKRGRLR